MSSTEATAPPEDEGQRRNAVAALGASGWERMKSGDLGSLPVILALIAIWAYFQSRESVFLSARNLSNLILQIGVTGTLAVGIVLVLLLGEIDLSVGSVMILSSALLAWAVVNKDWSWYWGVVFAVGTGLAIGVFQGFWFAVIGVPSFVVTLAGLLGWQGVMIHVLGTQGTININNDRISSIAGSYLPHFWGWVLAIGISAAFAVSQTVEAARRRRAGLPAAPILVVVISSALVTAIALLFTAILNGEFQTKGVENILNKIQLGHGGLINLPNIIGDYSSGVPTAGVILLGLVIFFQWLITRTRFGRYMFAVGGNAEAARRAGVNIKMIRIIVFGLCGMLAAVAGLIQASRLAAASLAINPGQVTLEAIAAAVIGGTSLFGGRGNVWSALLGALVIGSVGNGLDLIGQGPDVKLMVEGAILLLAVTVDAIARRGRSRPRMSRDQIGVGMLGYAFMGKAHSRALLALQHLDVPMRPELVSISGRNREPLERARDEWGWQRAVTDWREQIADEQIQLFDNGGPNIVHAEPTIAAVQAGKHVVCEKPLGMTADESHRMWTAAELAGVHHLCAFNYRFVPAVRLAREMLEAGDLGEVVHFRARYLQSWGWDADESVWRFDPVQAGTGAIGDLGTHIIDIARYLVGEIASVSALVKTIVPGRGVDDHFVAAVEFENGVAGTLEASRLARGRINSNAFEINGTKGSLTFDVERLNELEVADTRNFRRILVTEPEHPYMRHWWPPGHIVGWGDTFTHELGHMIEAIAGEHGVAPHGATFEDGYRCAEVTEAILRSAASGRKESISYKGAR